MHTSTNETEAKQHLDTIFQAALQRVDPFQMIMDHVRLVDSKLVIRMEDDHHEIDLAPYTRIFILGAGKATAPMAKAFEDILGDRITKGLIVVKYGHTQPLQCVETIESGHPVPDENGVRGADEIMKLAQEADADTLVLTLISGGGSALLPSPAHYEIDGETIRLPLEAKQDITKALLRCGADITEINCIRKHLSDLKGGRLLQHISPARSVNFILSDVVGDDLSSIASGMTTADPSTFKDALEILDKYSITNEISDIVLTTLRRGAQGEIEETLKKGGKAEALSTNILIGTNAKAMAAAKAKAESLGYNTVSLTSRITGEAKEVAKVLAAIAAETADSQMLVKKPACVISGGEPVVTLHGQGKGGRNQEMALAFLLEIKNTPELYKDVTFLAASTDGNDGPTDAAGAFASVTLLKDAEQAGLSPLEYLRNNDSYNFYDKLNGLCKTGPTNTNVCDLHMIIVR